MSMFAMSKAIWAKIESLIRLFLWSGKNQRRVMAKVSWSNVCKPKDLEGLSLKPL